MVEQKSKVWLFQVIALAALVNVMPGWQLAGIGARIWLIWLIVAAGGVLLLKETQRPRRKWTALDCLLGGCLVWNFLQIIVSAVKMERCDEGNLFLIGLLILFFYASMARTSSYMLRDVLLVGAVPLYVRLLWYFLSNPAGTFNLAPLLEEEALASFLLLVCAAAAEGYCGGCRRGSKAGADCFYMGMAFISYFLLFTDGNIIGILLAGVSFPVSILLHRPEKEFVRRTMQMAFVYFFLLSNMSLLVNYTSLIKVEAVYNLEYSVYLELGIALAGVLFFSWWDKLPEGEGVILHGLQKRISWVLSGAGVCLFLLLAMGSRLEGMGDGMGMTLLLAFTEAVREYCAGHNGSFFDALSAGGAAGGLWFMCTGLLGAKQLARQVRRKRVDAASVMIVVLYLAQALFFSQKTASAPVYVIFAACALYGKNDGMEDGGPGLWESAGEWLKSRMPAGGSKNVLKGSDQVKKAVFGVEKAVSGVENAVFGVKKAASGVENAVFGVEKAVSRVENAVFGVEKAVFRVKKAGRLGAVLAALLILSAVPVMQAQAANQTGQGAGDQSGSAEQEEQEGEGQESADQENEGQEGGFDQPEVGVEITGPTMMYAVKKVNVRKEPGTSSEQIGQLEEGDRIFAVELTEEGWYRVTFEGGTGYIRKDFLAVYTVEGDWDESSGEDIGENGQNGENGQAPDGSEEQTGQEGQTGQGAGGEEAQEGQGQEAGGEEAQEGQGQESKEGQDDTSSKSGISNIIIIVLVVAIILVYAAVQITKEHKGGKSGEEGEEEKKAEGVKKAAEGKAEGEGKTAEKKAAGEGKAEGGAGKETDHTTRKGTNRTAKKGMAHTSREEADQGDDGQNLVILDLDAEEPKSSK